MPDLPLGLPPPVLHASSLSQLHNRIPEQIPVWGRPEEEEEEDSDVCNKHLLRMCRSLSLAGGS